MKSKSGFILIILFVLLLFVGCATTQQRLLDSDSSPVEEYSNQIF